MVADFAADRVLIERERRLRGKLHETGLDRVRLGWTKIDSGVDRGITDVSSNVVRKETQLGDPA